MLTEHPQNFFPVGYFKVLWFVSTYCITQGPMTFRNTRLCFVVDFIFVSWSLTETKLNIVGSLQCVCWLMWCFILNVFGVHLLLFPLFQVSPFIFVRLWVFTWSDVESWWKELPYFMEINLIALFWTLKIKIAWK